MCVCVACVFVLTMKVDCSCYVKMNSGDVVSGIPRSHWKLVLLDIQFHAVCSFICCKEWSVFITQGIEGVIEYEVEG